MAASTVAKWADFFSMTAVEGKENKSTARFSNMLPFWILLRYGTLLIKTIL